MMTNIKRNYSLPLRLVFEANAEKQILNTFLVIPIEKVQTGFDGQYSQMELESS